MKFKVGDTVRIKELNERERHHEDLSYVNEMIKYQGQIHQITQVDTRKKEYGITFPKKGNERNYWYYKEEWLEEPIEYEAF